MTNQPNAKNWSIIIPALAVAAAINASAVDEVVVLVGVDAAA